MIENKTIENKSIVIFFLLTRVLCVLSAYTLKCLRCLPDASRACITTEWTCHSRNALCATRRISSFAGVVFYGALCFNCEKKKKKILHWSSFPEAALSCVCRWCKNVWCPPEDLRSARWVLRGLSQLWNFQDCSYQPLLHQQSMQRWECPW